MTLRSYLWGMRVSTLISFLGWALVVQYIDPDKSGATGEALFYLSTFLLTSGIFILLFTRLQKRRLEGEADISSALGLNFRRGVLLGLLVVVLLFLQEARIFAWWLALLIFAGICLIELHFITSKK